MASPTSSPSTTSGTGTGNNASSTTTTPSKRAAAEDNAVDSTTTTTSPPAATSASSDIANDNDTVNDAGAGAASRSEADAIATPSKRPRISQEGDYSEVSVGVGSSGASASATTSSATTANASGGAVGVSTPPSSNTNNTNNNDNATNNDNNNQQQHTNGNENVIDITNTNSTTSSSNSSSESRTIIRTPAPMPSREREVIEICTTPPKKKAITIGKADEYGVVIKQDPAGNTTSIAMDDDSDSEVEILSPSKYPKQHSDGGSGHADVDDNMDTDEIQVTASTMTRANVDYAHVRHQCGIHPFSALDGNMNTNAVNGNAKYCAKCYCFLCDTLASDCKEWKAHCHAHDKNEQWVQVRERNKNVASKGEVSAVQRQARSNPYGRQGSNRHEQITGLIHNEFLSRLASDNNNNNNNSPNSVVDEQQRRQERMKERKDMRISEVLLENFNKAVSLQEKNLIVDENATTKTETTTASNDKTITPQHQKMEGDIPTLSLHPSFFVNGIKIGWPFPEIMKPQRQMAIHLIKALKGKKHVVLESPTGTGKSAAILCSVLGWQRWHHRMESAKRRDGNQNINIVGGGGVISSPMRNGGDDDNGKAQKVKIIYCSRTHSQVAQMVQSLKSTPYRPRMAILGSRERLCIHKSIKPRGRNAEPITGINVNNECRTRVRNTEKTRKQQLTNPSHSRGGVPYDDDDPPEFMQGDGGQDEDVMENNDEDDPMNEDGGGNGYLGRKKTCPHYRQLSTARTANLAHSAFVPDSKAVNCCSVGGKKSKFGAHDIEDLVNFGVDPYVQKDVAVYRRNAVESFGLSIKGGGRSGGCYVREVKKGTPAEVPGSIKEGDKILRVNGSDVSASDVKKAVDRIKATAPSDPLMLDVSRGGSGSLSSGGEEGEYSSRAACPYYISQVLSKDADIVFAPYNYVLDPGIREALGIELGNSVVILDEAHNVETTLREAGSGKFGEFELCELLVMLNNYAMTEKSTGNLIDTSGDAGLAGESETQYLCDVAHTLLLFVEKITNKLRTARTCFQNNPGAKGAAQALRDYEKFHSPDDTGFTVTFDGPTGKGHNGKCVGCLPFFEKLNLTQGDMEGLCKYGDSFEQHFRGQSSSSDSAQASERDRVANLVDRLMDLVHKLSNAMKTPEHYYAAVVATANGNLEFANGGDAESETGGGRGGSWKKKPRALPLIAPRTPAYPDRLPNPCTNAFCRQQAVDVFHPIRHGESCDGSMPKWEAHLHLDLLTPGPLMQELSNQCRTVVLASGSLSPIPSLCAELNLFPADGGPLSPVRRSTPALAKPVAQIDPSDALPKVQKRLQNQPMPLEADHVVDLNKQLFAVSIGHFPDGSELRVVQKNSKQPEFLSKLGDALVRIVSGIPEGGVLIFLPSYALLRKCEKLWNPDGFRRQNNRRWWAQREEESGEDGPSVFDRLKSVKHKVIVEPSGSQDAFEEAKREYMDSVRTEGGCVLLAVYRGKMSEGISFNDSNARGVICIGLPLPSVFALPIKVKMDYNDEQRKLRKRTDLLPGNEWYRQQAFRAIAQALGRCIRHAGDYGAIFLLDSRHCDDGSPNEGGLPRAHKNLPKWMRSSVKNLSKNSSSGRGGASMFNYMQSSNSTITGGWTGLKTELHRFFRNAKPHADGVLIKQKEKMMAAAAKNGNVAHTFNGQTNKWTSTEKESTTPPSGKAGTASSSLSSPRNSSISATSMHTRLPTNAEASTKTYGSGYVIGRQPPKITSSQGSARKGTLQDMFKKQQQTESTEGSQKRPPGSASKFPKNANNTSKSSLKSMFEKQRAAAAPTSPLVPVQKAMDVDQEKDEETTKPTDAVSDSADPTPIQQSSNKKPNAPAANNSLPANSFSFKRSPFANEVLTPATEVAASTSQLVLSQSQAPLVSASQLASMTQSQAACGTQAGEEHLCVVCEDAKKDVILLPCKHMCLCKNCADACLFKTMKECPMCRTEIKDSLGVFW